jgi:hypothetical protein
MVAAAPSRPLTLAEQFPELDPAEVAAAFDVWLRLLLAWIASNPEEKAA